MLRAGMCSIPIGIAITVGTLHSAWTHVGLGRDAWGARQSLSVIQNWHFEASVIRPQFLRTSEHVGVNLGDLELEPATTEGLVFFEERFPIRQRFASFDKRFINSASLVGPAFDPMKTEPVRLASATAAQTESQVAALPNTATRSASPTAGQLVPEIARVPRPAFNNRIRAAKAGLDPGSMPDTKIRTAFYDISAQVVYLPDGRRLEAHSGLGSHMDNAAYVHVKDQGPTPPNTYRLALRENLFHGVRAIRLIPVGDGNMFGRDGILAHHYLLGPNGESNGCVSFADYPEFLNAYLNGEIDRLVVVEHIEGSPGPVIAAGWLTTAFKGLLKPFERGAGI